MVRMLDTRLRRDARARAFAVERTGAKKSGFSFTDAEANGIAQVARRFGGVSALAKRYYDFNVWSERKQVEKLKYIHRNPVKRGLVTFPEDWQWSSFRHYLTGEPGIVEIESHWTAKSRSIPVGPSQDPPFASR